MNCKFKPKGSRQEDYVRAIIEHDLILCSGPAGSGKTACSIGMAMRYLTDDSNPINKIVLIRPTIGTDFEIDQGIGYLTGGLLEKMAPYVRPLMEELSKYMSKSALNDAIDKSIIDIIPLFYCRGLTFHNSFVILDESQNASFNQIKMVLTRLGKRSKIILNGDVDQHDRHSGKCDFQIWIEDIIGDDDEIPVCKLYKEDIIRHHLVKRILEKVEKYESTS